MGKRPKGGDFQRAGKPEVANNPHRSRSLRKGTEGPPPPGLNRTTRADRTPAMDHRTCPERQSGPRAACTKTFQGQIALGPGDSLSPAGGGFWRQCSDRQQSPRAQVRQVRSERPTALGTQPGSLLRLGQLPGPGRGLPWQRLRGRLLRRPRPRSVGHDCHRGCGTRRHLGVAAGLPDPSGLRWIQLVRCSLHGPHPLDRQPSRKRTPPPSRTGSRTRRHRLAASAIEDASGRRTGSAPLLPTVHLRPSERSTPCRTRLSQPTWMVRR